MCGRYTLTDPDPQALRVRFELPGDSVIDQPARFNIAPTSEVLAVRRVPRDAGEVSARESGLLRWGLVPSFADPATFDRLLINARSETVASKPVFREAFESGRCLIPADGFYEWQKTETGKRPHYFSLPGRDLFAFAGISSRAQSGDGSILTSCSLLTCEPSAEVAPVHKRMPVILAREDEARWLSPDVPVEELLEMMRPFPGLAVREVSESVNSSRNEGPELLEPPMNLF
jgi:putative SOS response-associated peptidase YedK